MGYQGLTPSGGSPQMGYQGGMHSEQVGAYGDAYSTFPSQNRGPDEQDGGFYYPQPNETIYAQDTPGDAPPDYGGTYQQPHPAYPQQMGTPQFGGMANPPSTILPPGGQMGTPQFGVMAAPPSMMLPPVQHQQVVSYPPNPLAVHGSPARRRDISPGRQTSDTSMQTDPIRDLGVRLGAWDTQSPFSFLSLRTAPQSGDGMPYFFCCATCLRASAASAVLGAFCPARFLPCTRL